MIEERAATMCSERMRSTVAKKGGPSVRVGGGVEDPVAVEDIISDEDSPPFGRTERDGERDLEFSSGEYSGEVQSWLRDVSLVPGVRYPGHRNGSTAGLWSTSDDALSKRFVVPRDFVEPDRAEHTTATL